MCESENGVCNSHDCPIPVGCCDVITISGANHWALNQVYVRSSASPSPDNIVYIGVDNVHAVWLGQKTGTTRVTRVGQRYDMPHGAGYIQGQIVGDCPTGGTTDWWEVNYYGQWNINHNIKIACS